MRSVLTPKAFFSKGITLLELMVVVAIIGIIAMAAIPTLSQSTRNRTAYDAASEILNMFKVQRYRAANYNLAMGLRISGDVVTPVAFNSQACLITGDSPKEITGARPLDLNQSPYQDIVTLKDDDGAALNMVLCIRPDGRTSDGNGGALSPLSDGAFLIRVARKDIATGRQLAVAIPFNGAVRMSSF